MDETVSEREMTGLLHMVKDVVGDSRSIAFKEFGKPRSVSVGWQAFWCIFTSLSVFKL
jgi:hypothetical protein